MKITKKQKPNAMREAPKGAVIAALFGSKSRAGSAAALIAPPLTDVTRKSKPQASIKLVRKSAGPVPKFRAPAHVVRPFVNPKANEVDKLASELRAWASTSQLQLKSVISKLDELLAATATTRQAMSAITESSRTKTNQTQTEVAIPAAFAGMELMCMATVEKVVGAKRSTIYGWIKKGKFPKQVKLSPKASRFFAADIKVWLDARSDDRGNDDTTLTNT